MKVLKISISFSINPPSILIIPFTTSVKTTPHQGPCPVSCNLQMNLGIYYSSINMLHHTCEDLNASFEVGVLWLAVMKGNKSR